MKKRLLSLLLALVMVVSMLPVQALAEETEETGALPEILETMTTEEETEAPEEETEAPEEETEAPEEETEAPEETTEAPEEATEAPEEATEAPEEETEAPEETPVPEETTPVLKLWDAEGELPVVDGTYVLTLTVGSPVELTVKRGEDVCGDYTFRTESEALTLSRDADTGLTTLEPVEAASDVSVIFTDSREEAAEVTLLVQILPGQEPAPEEETEAPAEEAEEPTEETEAPTEETEAPTEETEAPTEETEATEAPQEETEAPAEAILPESEATDPVDPENIQEESRDRAPAATLFITNLPETLRMGSKALTLKVADENNAAYKGALTWELRASEENQNGEDVYYLLNAMANLSSKGVLTTSAVYDQRVKIEVRAVADENTFTDWTAVTLVPPLESFRVNVDWYSQLPKEESHEGGVNRKDNWPWEFDIKVDYVLLYVDEILPKAASPDVSWSIKVNSKVADYQIDNGTVRVTPKTPGKLTFTATAKDGSGAKYSGIIEFYGDIDHIEMADPTEYTLKAGESHTYRVNAWYDPKGERPIAKPEVRWSVYELLDGPEKNPYRVYTDLATISKTGVLKVSKNAARNAELLVVAEFGKYDEEIGEWITQEASVKVNIRPAKEKTLVIAEKWWDDTLTEFSSGALYPPECSFKVTAAFYDATTGQLEELPDVPLTVKNAAYDRATGEVTLGAKENVKVTISASYQNQKASVFLTVGHWSEQVKVTTEVVPSGKSTNLTAESLFHNGKTDKDQKTKLQKFTWYLWDPCIYWDESCDYESIVEGVTAKLSKSGRLTVPKLDYDGYVKVSVVDAYYTQQDVIIRVSAIKQTKATLTINEGTVWAYNCFNDNVALNFLDPEAEAHITPADYDVSVLVDGRFYPGDQVEITGFTVNKPKIAKVVYDNNNRPGVQFTGTLGSVTLTITGNTKSQNGEASVPFTVKKTLKVINAVESVTLNGPTTGVVGKSLNLKPVVNKEATNKKLNWYIHSRNFYGAYFDKTSIKNGVIKFDNSFFTESRTYTVTCTSDDGFFREQWDVEAEAAATSIAVVGLMGAINGTTQKLAVDGTLPFKITAMAGGTLLRDPTVTVKSSNNKVASAIQQIETGAWIIIGNKPGTATITVTGNSGKKATFKVTVTDKKDVPWVEVTNLDPRQETLITNEPLTVEFKVHFPGVTSGNDGLRTMCYLLMPYDDFVLSPDMNDPSRYTLSCSSYDPSGSQTLYSYVVIGATNPVTNEYVYQLYPIVTTVSPA